MSKSVHWKPCTPRTAAGIENAVVAGDDCDGSMLWVIRAKHRGDLIPGKLRIKHGAAYVAWYGGEHSVGEIEVCCAKPGTVCWVECEDGQVPPTAVAAGHTSAGETLYVGRAEQKGSLTPGKVHPTHKCMYMSFAGKELTHTEYEVLCTRE